MESPSQLREALRWLLLPIAPANEAEAVQAALEQLDTIGVEVDDRVAWVETELIEWRDTGDAGLEFGSVVEGYIKAGDPDSGEALADGYFQLHHAIRSEPLFDHDRTSIFLSHARMIGLLALEEGLSSSQIARLVVARDPELPVDWRLVERVLRALELRPSISLSDVQELVVQDAELEVEVFADADLATCIAMVSEAGRRLGLGLDLSDALHALFPTQGTPFGPYLQMLHFLCTVPEFHDSALSAIYEFTPRGEVPLWLFDRYPPALGVRGNPFLNNAKSVDTLDRSWASSKKPAQKRLAHALVTVVEALDSMGFAARRELASSLRRLLLRTIRLARGTEVRIPGALDGVAVTAVLETIARGETRTQGVLEQRLVDALAVLAHPAPTWLARGLGDSVNATNMSRSKCGDCDFQDGAARKVQAYEPHAGKLTDIYMEAHSRTLRRVLAARAEEWEQSFGKGEGWDVRVTFVAHELDTSGTRSFDVDGATVTIDAVTYSELADGVDTREGTVLEAFDDYFLRPLSEPRTPDAVRAVLNEILT